MATPSIFNKNKLSASTDGAPIKVVATSTTGTTIHTAVSGTTANTWDEVWLWAFNTDTTARKLTVEFDIANQSGNTLEVTIPPESGAFLLVPGWVMQNGKLITAFCASANVVWIGGYVNEIRP